MQLKQIRLKKKPLNTNTNENPTNKYSDYFIYEPVDLSELLNS
jgi:hypothetical protein